MSEFLKFAAGVAVVAALAFVVLGVVGVAEGSGDGCTEAFRAVCRAVRIAN